MRELRRSTFGHFLGMSFAADRRGAWLTLLLFTFRPVLTVLLTVGLGILVTATIAGDAVGSTLAGLGVCIALVAQIASARYSLNVSATMIDRTARLVDTELQGALHGTASVHHFLDPAVLDQLHLVRAERARLTEGADITGLIIGTVLRLALTIVVAAAATPWLLLVPAAALLAYGCSRRAEDARERGRQRAASAARHQQLFVQTASRPGHRDELLLSDGGELVRRSHAALAARAERDRARGVWVALGWTAAGALATAAALAVGAWVLAGAVVAGTARAGAYVSALLLLSSTSGLMNAVVRYVGSLSESLRLTRTYRSLLDVLRADQAPRSRPAGTRLRAVSVVGASYTYPGSARPALDDVTLDLQAGHVYALVGANGSGKSTLTHLLTGMLRPDSGEVAHVDESGASRPTGAHTSLVAQDFARLEFALEDSIILGRSTVPAGALTSAVEESGLAESVLDATTTMNTALGRSLPGGRELSGGQWQRVALARGLYASTPDLLVLDEPTSAIDPLAEDQMLQRFVDRSARVARESGGVAVIVTHRMSLVRDVDAVILLEAGKVVAVGPHAELLSHPAYRSLYESQSRHYLVDAGEVSGDD